MSVAVLDPAALARCREGDVLHAKTLAVVSMTQLAFYCATVGVTDPIHYDREFARKAGFADAVVNGSLRVAWMAQILADLAPARLESLNCSHRGVMLVGEAPRFEVRLRSHQRTPEGATRIEVTIEATVGDAKRDVGEATLRWEGA